MIAGLGVHAAVGAKRRGRPRVEDCARGQNTRLKGETGGTQEKGVAEQLAGIRGQLNELLARKSKRAEERIARERLAASGDGAAPLTTGQVALVLNLAVQTVHRLVSEGKLKRACGKCGFRAEDVRGFLARVSTER